MPWKAIAYVSSGITLAAFVIAVAAWVYRTKMLARERTLRLAPESERAFLIERALEFFHIDTSELTREQKYSLALHQIHERARRFRTTAFVVVIIAGFAAGMSVVAIYWVPTQGANGGAGSPSPDRKQSSPPTTSPISTSTPIPLGTLPILQTTPAPTPTSAASFKSPQVLPIQSPTIKSATTPSTKYYCYEALEEIWGKVMAVGGSWRDIQGDAVKKANELCKKLGWGAALGHNLRDEKRAIHDLTCTDPIGQVALPRTPCS